MEPNAKLFRAIVILGAALTASACDDHGKCGPGCMPGGPDGGVIIVTDARDAGPPPLDAPSDATPMDVIVII